MLLKVSVTIPSASASEVHWLSKEPFKSAAVLNNTVQAQGSREEQTQFPISEAKINHCGGAAAAGDG